MAWYLLVVGGSDARGRPVVADAEGEEDRDALPRGQDHPGDPVGVGHLPAQVTGTGVDVVHLAEHEHGHHHEQGGVDRDAARAGQEGQVLGGERDVGPEPGVDGHVDHDDGGEDADTEQHVERELHRGLQGRGTTCLRWKTGKRYTSDYTSCAHFHIKTFYLVLLKRTKEYSIKKGSCQ